MPAVRSWMNCPLDGLLIIGIGNPLRGDDDVGPRLARKLRLCGIAAEAVHQLAPEVAEQASRSERVLFVDADMHSAPGEIHLRGIGAEANSPFEHHSTPAGLLTLARELYGKEPAARLLTIGGESY